MSPDTLSAMSPVAHRLNWWAHGCLPPKVDRHVEDDGSGKQHGEHRTGTELSSANCSDGYAVADDRKRRDCDRLEILTCLRKLVDDEDWAQDERK